MDKKINDLCPNTSDVQLAYLRNIHMLNFLSDHVLLYVSSSLSSCHKDIKLFHLLPSLSL